VGTLAERFRRAAALGPRDWFLIAEAWIELARAGAALRFNPARAVRGVLDQRPATQSSEHDLPPQLLEMFLIAARYNVFNVSCLPKALALKRMLERRRFSPALRIGARTEAGTLMGHAWIEIDDVPFNDSADVAVRYPPLEIGEAGLATWTSQ
jgi:hypothetical protein